MHFFSLDFVSFIRKERACAFKECVLLKQCSSVRCTFLSFQKSCQCEIVLVLFWSNLYSYITAHRLQCCVLIREPEQCDFLDYSASLGEVAKLSFSLQSTSNMRITSVSNMRAEEMSVLWYCMASDCRTTVKFWLHVVCKLIM